MSLSLFLSVLLVFQVKAPSGTITGRIEVPNNVRITKPAQVVVFPGEYAEVYSTELQLQIDGYWEEHKKAFIQEKEAFLFFRERAKNKALDSTLARMRRDNPLKAVGYVVNTASNTFEFHDLPQGECKVLARVVVNNQELVWSESVILTGDTPVVLVLKPTTP